MLGASAFSHRVRILRRATDGGDGNGNRLAGWDSAILLGRRSAAFRPDYGGEQIKAGRLESGLVGTLTLRAEAITRGLTGAERIVFDHPPYAGVVMEIGSVVPSPDGHEIGLTLVQTKP